MILIQRNLSSIFLVVQYKWVAPAGGCHLQTDKEGVWIHFFRKGDEGFTRSAAFKKSNLLYLGSLIFQLQTQRDAFASKLFFGLGDISTVLIFPPN